MADPSAAAVAAVEVGAPDSLPPPAAEETDAAAAEEEAAAAAKRWPGWPGDSVFRLVVPVLKVGSIIGRKGELIKRLVEESKARVRILEGPVGATERIVLVSGKEDLGLELPPAMDALMRVFKRVIGIADGATEGSQAAAAPGVCAARLLVPGAQAINLIGKQGATIKSIQESTGATIRVISVGKVSHTALITQTMQIPLTYAEDIIGVKGANIAYIRANSGAVVTIQESLGSPDDITVEIKGTSSQVQAAQQLIQDSLAAHREPVRSSYVGAGLDPVYRPSYSQYGSSTYSSSSLPSYSSSIDDGRYPSSGLGGYGSSYRY
nr:unnamed protein product [Digitaria exilis]